MRFRIFLFLVCLFLSKESNSESYKEIYDEWKLNYKLEPISQMNLVQQIRDTTKSTDLFAYSTQFLGSRYLRQGKKDSAFVYLSMAGSLFSDLDDLYGITLNQLSFSTFYETFSIIEDSALSLSQEVYLNSILLGDTALMLESLNRQANLFLTQGAYHQAKDQIKKMDPLIERSGLTTFYFTSCNTLANIYGKEDKLDSALLFRDRAYERLDTTFNRVAYYEYLHSKGIDLFLAEQDSLALYYLDEAIRVAEGMNNESYVAEVNMRKAYPMYWYYGKQESADQFKLAISQLKPLGDVDELLEAYETLSFVYHDMGQYDSAYNYLYLYISSKDSFEENSISEDYIFLQWFFMNQEVELKSQIKILRAEKETETARIETERKNRQLKVWVISSIIVLLSLAALLAFVRYRNKKNEELAEAEVQRLENENELNNTRILNLLKEQESASIEAMVQGQEEERQRIAKDLHDSLGSMLSTVKLHFDALQAKLDYLETGDLQDYENSKGLLDNAVVELRRISHDMVSGKLVKFGIVHALEELAGSLPPGPNSPNVMLDVSSYESDLSGTQEVAIYRILQELLQNSLKHGKPENITIQLSSHEDEVIIMYEEDGKGFDVQEVESAAGIGWKNMRERAETLKFNLSVDSMPGRGMTAIIEVPISR